MKKKTVKLFFIFLLSFFVSYAPADEPAKTPETRPVNVIIDGEYLPGVSAYAITESTYFLSIREAAEIYNAVLEWKPVSSVVSMHFGNKKIDIKTDSNTVIFGKTVKKMTLPSRLIKGELYVSPELFVSPEFSDISETDSTWNGRAFILNVLRRSNIESVRYFTTPQSTQIITQLSEPLSYSVSKSTGAIVLNIHRGKIQRDFIYANNGAVRDILFDTDGKSAIITVNLQQSPKLVKSLRLKNPDRIAIDIEHSKEIDLSYLAETTIPETEAAETASAFSSGDAANIPEKYAQTQIGETIAPIEAGEDNSDLSKIPVAKFDEKTIIDDSYTIVDDTATIAEVLPAKAPEKKKKEFKRKRIIVIDAGHGGEDPGAVGPNGTKEKDINLAIAYELKKIFDADDEYEILLTRKDDSFIPLAERTNIANEYSADLFVSIHCNSNFNRGTSGFEIYFLSEQATDSEAAATATLENSVLELEGKPTKKRALLQEMLWSMMLNEYMNDSSELCSFISGEASGRLKIANRGVKQASFYVLRGSQMPSVLVEAAFLSNYAEESRLNTGRFQSATADSVYEGIKKFYARKDKKETVKK
jgi:N-acetylmuramoyl-L-alanine amidase